MHKIIKMIQDEAVEAVEAAKMNVACEHAPPGAAFSGDESIHTVWVLAHHEYCTAWMGDNVVNPDG